MEEFRFVKTDGTNPDFVAMCRKLDQNLDEIVGTKFQRSKYAKYNTLDSIHDVIVIYRGTDAVGSGSYKKYDEGTIEIKRVYIDRPYRGLGLGKRLLHALEEDAVGHNYQYAVLETGTLLTAASALYRSIGYEVISNYGQYKDMAESVCMRKELAVKKI